MRLGDKGVRLLGVQMSKWDLGVIMQSDVRVDMQCNKATVEVNKRLGMII